jgi:hypothetical protein
MASSIPELITGRVADDALPYLDLAPADEAAVREVATQIAADRDLCADLAGVLELIRPWMGVPQPWGVVELPKRYDPLAGDAPAIDRWWYVVAALAFVPETLAYHRSRGIADQVSRATLADIGRHARITEVTFGRPGFHQEKWIQIHLRGLLYDLGRLQFNLTTLWLPDAQLAAAGMRARSGEVVLDTHIPDSGPLTPDEVTASFNRARGFFMAHFPEHAPYDYALCNSWLLDPQLTMLVPGTNIDSFCRRWTILDPGIEADRSALEFIFRKPTTPVEDLPRDTRLQRAVIDHVTHGGHLMQAVGYVTV